MNKIKELPKTKSSMRKKIEIWLVSTTVRYTKVENLVASLQRILEHGEAHNLTNYVENKTATDNTAVKTMVNNVLRNILEARPYSSSKVPKKLLLDITIATSRGVVESLSQIVGVQPISAPVGLVYTMQCRPTEGDNTTNADDSRLSLAIVSSAVEAATRKLQTAWSFEAMCDMSLSLYNLDIENEMIKATSSEIIGEVVNEVMSDLIRNAEKSSIQLEDGSDSMFIGDTFTPVGVAIGAGANRIGNDTRRGCGNFIVCSPIMVSILQTSAKSVFAPAVAGSFKGPNNFMLVGILNGTISVYSYISNQLSGHDDVERILIGYKGRGTDTDVGYVYAPYMPALSSGVAINPKTFQPVENFVTRYGKMFNSAAYYHVVEVKLPSSLTGKEPIKVLTE